MEPRKNTRIRGEGVNHKLNDNRSSCISFGEDKILRDFKELASGRFEDKRLYANLLNAFDELKLNPLAGVVISKSKWPREYVKKYAINNLQKFDLPDGWRLVYTLDGSEEKLAITVLEWLKHKDYEKRFHYEVG